MRFLPSRYVGDLDGILDRHIVGWVLDRKQPTRRVGVRFGPGSLDRWIVADAYRADVAKAGRSRDGYCGFKIALSSLADAATVLVQISPAHQPIRPGAASGTTLSHAHDGSIRYAFDRRLSIVSGFAVDTAEPRDRRRLRIEDDRGIDFGTHSACVYDPRVKTSDIDGFHGFRILATPASGRLLDAATGFLIGSW